jgi:hypothetical protein
MIYPADMLQAMVGKKITQVKFYADGQINLMDGSLYLSLNHTEKTNFDNLEEASIGETNACIVPEFGSNELVFDLGYYYDTPDCFESFTYEGGNLLITVGLDIPGDINDDTYFKGTNVSFNASLARTWFDNGYDWMGFKYLASEFLPMVTFTYEDVSTPDPSQMTAAPTFNGYTEDGIYAYFVEIIPTEESVIYYRIQYPDGTWTEWAEYEDILSFTGDGKYRVEACAVATGKLPSYEIAYEFVVAPMTGVNELVEGKTIAGVRYFNMAGQEMPEANGMTIVVTTYTDGTTSAVKVVK